MKLKLILSTVILFTLASFSAQAETIRRGPSCAVLTEQALALFEFRKTSEPKLKMKLPACECSSEKFEEGTEGYSTRCQMDMAALLPTNIRDWMKTTSATDGPNCFDLALKPKDLVPSQRYVDYHEIEYILSKKPNPLCEKVKGRLKSGDIFLLSSETKTTTPPVEIGFHAFIYISPEVALSKNGFHNQTNYEVTSPHAVLEKYEIEKKCQPNGDQISLATDCNPSASAYRCNSFSTWFQSIHPTLKPKTLQAYRDEQVLEETISMWSKYGECMESPSRPITDALFQAQLKKTRTEIENRLKVAPALNKNEAFVIGLLKERFNSIVIQWESAIHQNSNLTLP